MVQKFSIDMIHISPQSAFTKALDTWLRPLMRGLSGAWHEEPQSTHRYNYQLLSDQQITCLKAALMVSPPIDDTAKSLSFCGIPKHHLTFLGGWKKYVVLMPAELPQVWYIGWLRSDSKGVSQIQLRSPVRMLLCREEVKFFAVDTLGNQIPLKIIGLGRVGDGGVYSNLPLL